jgi:hypothetical protein
MPIFPKNYQEQMEQAKEWEAFHAEVDAEISRLNEKLNRINQEVHDKMAKKGSKKNEMDIAKVFAMTKAPYLSAKANHVLSYYMDNKDGKLNYQFKKLTEENQKYGDLDRQEEEAFKQFMKTEKDKYKGRDGEGSGPSPDLCPVFINAFNKKINIQNTEYENVVNENLEYWSNLYEACAYFYQYSVSDQLLIDQYELQLKLDFLKQVWNIHPNLGYYDIAGCVQEEIKDPGRDYLAEWNDLYCDRNISFTIPLTGTWRFTCNTTEFHLEPLLLPFEVHYKENLETGNVISASAAVSIKREIAGTGVSVKAGAGYDGTKGTVKLEGGVGTTIGKTNVGPLPVKAGVSGGGFIEIDKNGITDFGGKGGIEAKPDIGIGEGKDKSDLKIGKVEVGGKWSWNAGGSGVAKGTLNGSINPSNFSAPSKK